MLHTHRGRFRDNSQAAHEKVGGWHAWKESPPKDNSVIAHPIGTATSQPRMAWRRCEGSRYARQRAAPPCCMQRGARVLKYVKWRAFASAIYTARHVMPALFQIVTPTPWRRGSGRRYAFRRWCFTITGSAYYLVSYTYDATPPRQRRHVICLAHVDYVRQML